MQEFIYYNASGLDFPVSEQIFVTTNIEDTKNKNFLISNTNEIPSELTAQEIDFYIKNSQDNLSNKIKNVSKLYEIAAVKYDLALDIPFSAEISNNVLLISQNQEQYDKFISSIEAKDFELFSISENIIKSISGNIGNLQVIVTDEDEDITLNVSQIVWFDAKQTGKERSGVFDTNLLNVDEIIKLLKENINSYTYKKFTTYDPTICQYNERRVEICSKCEEVCPTVAITKDDKTKTLTFSQIDCDGCGGCVSVCPSGALDYAPTNRDSIFEMSKFYKETHPLIVPSKMNMQNLMINLKENVLPFAIEGEKFLSEVSFLTLLQMSGSQVVFYSDVLSKGTKDSIRILNDIYQKKYQKDAILVAMDKEELEDALNEVSFIENSYFNFNQNELKKREAFSQRLQKIVGTEDLGVVKTGEHIHYGRVLVNEANCTLCLACVGACNVDALFANESDFTLRVNPSLCTACGYCEVSCPEVDCLTIVRDEIELQPTWFKENILAKDKLFACVECGKEFATTKAIEKIANMMGAIFALSSETKKRTLYCCEDCKPKIMIKQGLLDA
ncbi:MAG: 4Fe-4S binding protein [Aliarcobacter sp.]|jgi:ferredoxin|nr:4Fe-4S binding protein [Aliarcobacter sp.]